MRRRRRRYSSDSGWRSKWDHLVLLILVEVFSIIRLEQLSVILGSILAYIPNAVVAVVILVAGYGVGQFAARSLAGILENTSYPVWMASVAKYAILVLAATMSLEQLGIAETIVVTAFSILLGSLGLAAAIAIGLGSKDVVNEWMRMPRRSQKKATNHSMRQLAVA
jgi:small-conductance mechanosensitive channel